MKKYLLIILLISTGILTISSTMKEYHPAYSSQPPQGYSGVNGFYCNSCHAGALNQLGGMVTATGLPDSYVAGSTYNFSITITHSVADRIKWGFSIEARNSANQSVGTFSTINPNAAPNGSGNELSHFNAVTTGPQASFTYDNLMWTAPAIPGINDQNITFYFVGNAANGNGANSGDFIYASTSASVLPVKLSKFSAILIKNTVALKWITETESNTKFFSVEKSTNGIQFFETGRVPAAGFSSSTLNYTYEDAAAGTAGELIYYRIVTIDLDGKRSVSEVRLIRPGRTAGDFILNFGPNPVQRTAPLQISYYASQGGVLEINIYSLTGRQVYKDTRKTSDGLNAVRLNVNQFAAGQYAAEFILNGRKELRKIIIQ